MSRGQFALTLHPHLDYTHPLKVTETRIPSYSPSPPLTVAECLSSSEDLIGLKYPVFAVHSLPPPPLHCEGIGSNSFVYFVGLVTAGSLDGGSG